MANFPSNLSCSSSANLLVKAYIILAIVREQPRCRIIWLFVQVNCHRRSPACSQDDWSAISNASNINYTWEYFHKNLLNSFSHTQFIPSHLLLFYPFSPPCCTESCGDPVAVKQLASSTWKVNLTEVQPIVFFFFFTSKATAHCQVTTLPRESMFTRKRGLLFSFQPN